MYTQKRIKGISASKIARVTSVNRQVAKIIAKTINKSNWEYKKPVHVNLGGYYILITLTNETWMHDDTGEGIPEYPVEVFVFDFFSGSEIKREGANTHNIESSRIICSPDILTSKFNISEPNNCLVYLHRSARKDKKVVDGKNWIYHYHGYTSKTMMHRYNQHLRANSNFGNALRDFLSISNESTPYWNVHMVIADGLTKKEAMKLEGECINNYSLWRNGGGNNRLPGGEEGDRIAKKLGYANYHEGRNAIEDAYGNPEKLNKICAIRFNWEPLTDEQKTEMACNRETTFDKNHIRFIRICSLQLDDVDEIIKLLLKEFPDIETSIHLKRRLNHVIQGKTYRFDE